MKPEIAPSRSHPKTGRVPALMPIEIWHVSLKMFYAMFQHCSQKMDVV